MHDLSNQGGGCSMPMVSQLACIPKGEAGLQRVAENRHDGY